MRKILAGGKALLKKGNVIKDIALAIVKGYNSKAPVSYSDDSLTCATLRTNECLHAHYDLESCLHIQATEATTQSTTYRVLDHCQGKG